MNINKPRTADEMNQLIDSMVELSATNPAEAVNWLALALRKACDDLAAAHCEASNAHSQWQYMVNVHEICHKMLDDANVEAEDEEGNWHLLQRRIAILVDERDGFQKRIAELEAERQWISVEERLPPPDTEVLLRGSAAWYVVGYLSRKTGNYFESWDSTLVRVVTHWQPILEPPQETP